jgi:hypothetical protein
MCQRCHLRYDTALHMRHARTTRARRRAAGTGLLFLLLATTLIQFDPPALVVTVDVTRDGIADPDALVAREACGYLRAMGLLDGLPLAYTIRVMVPTPAGTWVPDLGRGVRGLLTHCP